MLLYVDAVFGLLSLIGSSLGGSAYWFLGPLLFGGGLSVDNLQAANTTITLIVAATSLAYGFAGLAVANGYRIGWKVGLGLAVGAVVFPLLAVGPGPVLTSTYVITYLFNIALVATLLHPESRNHQKIWFQ